eukprot:CAMPEP_0206473532 /NCGR_PEP_ID=MMETSP0324_2-20121206/32924_1 /ASSEMBLY_ACC=CAM_ASM_000836 /TAXON_ID=2866 /ORGANISM="Crypthecodinium cohnii, Strain Seligo" /LENGTH=130 /DNA_ID=CAMNT_0053948485 /DNA_START=369 /DNA_END=761 /DNA_ORIENTATION=-
MCSTSLLDISSGISACPENHSNNTSLSIESKNSNSSTCLVDRFATYCSAKPAIIESISGHCLDRAHHKRLRLRLSNVVKDNLLACPSSSGERALGEETPPFSQEDQCKFEGSSDCPPLLPEKRRCARNFG